MADPTARLLGLLSLLQTHRECSGTELADRLGVSTRTIRHDIDRLRELGYPVDATRGAAGGYRLGSGGRLPPLLLDDEEAVAVTVGLRAAVGIAGVEEAGTRALAKLEQVLPARLRPTIDAIRTSVEHGPENTGTDAPDPHVQTSVLQAIAAAIRDVEWLRFDYDDQPRLVEPYRLLCWQRRWYLIARDPRTDTWTTYRIDRMGLRMPTRRRFDPQPLPGGDYTAFAMRTIAESGWNVHARLRVDAPAEDVLARINPAVGAVEPIDEHRCVLVTGADSLDTVAAYIGMLMMDFTVESPAELIPRLQLISQRYVRAVAGSEQP
ncbi:MULTISPECIES: helix-turn-helix transcriptional regulator [Gordonia]|jgi:predicted DNA-binding transcriptional regulator YafY|uniref:WYL domain-containing protein n=2 Tax=Gordonia TaxID=2053 RepID=A0A9X3D4K2_9ACTN|nr:MULTISPECIES: WYL domain-containing protein [Gordonia]MAU84950.1 DNA-binding transcriptional regulator [Gordonia sp. (in: high G+C Gram-positive bacteria)]MCF3939530.1 WYL domain-containing protein [Gordonia tangerina]MCX2964339.1 WYL domain-containing protein [Gordonia aquimaris]